MSPHSTQLSADAFVEVVLRSGLIEFKPLDEALEKIRASALPEQSEDAHYLADQLVATGTLTRWQADKLLDGRHRGFFIGRYKLLRHLGSGGMGRVYLAEHTVMDRRVALKVLPLSDANRPDILNRFRQEARAVAALDHPNIVRAFDIDHEENVHFIVMEYVHGLDLHSLVTLKGPLSYRRAAEYIAQAAAGLEHAHRAGLIHRDVKPANLIAEDKGTIKLLDLGLAMFASEDKSTTAIHPDQVLGTVDYLAPEQRINSDAVDGRADIYSLGCTLYFLLTGHPPFPDGSSQERLHQHLHAEPKSIYTERPDAPRELVEICNRMMRKSPADRFQSAAAVAQELNNWLAGGSQSGSVIGLPEHTESGIDTLIGAGDTLIQDPAELLVPISSDGRQPPKKPEALPSESASPSKQVAAKGKPAPKVAQRLAPLADSLPELPLEELESSALSPSPSTELSNLLSSAEEEFPDLFTEQSPALLNLPDRTRLGHSTTKPADERKATIIWLVLAILAAVIVLGGLATMIFSAASG